MLIRHGKVVFLSAEESWESWMVIMNQFGKALQFCPGWFEKLHRKKDSLHVLWSVLLNVLPLKLFWMDSFIYDIYFLISVLHSEFFWKVIRVMQFQLLKQGLEIFNRLWQSEVSDERYLVQGLLVCFCSNRFIYILSQTAFKSLKIKYTWN